MRKRVLGGGTGPGGTFRGAAAYLEAFLRECPDVAIDWLGDYATRAPCSACEGGRLRPEARRRARRRDDGSPTSWRSRSSASRTRWRPSLSGVATPPWRSRSGASSRSRVEFLLRVGLGYLSLDRSALTLSGGEAQRIRLAAQLGSNLRGACYVLDEPTIGLHVRDNERLLDALTALRDRGNSLIVVEHDEETIRRADHLIDLGPGGRPRGRSRRGAGSAERRRRRPRFARRAACSRVPPPAPRPSRGAAPRWLEVVGASEHNLRDVSVGIPLGRLTRRHGRLGLRQVHARARRAPRGRSPGARGEGGEARRAPGAPRRRAPRARARSRPDAGRQDAALGARDLPRHLGRAPAAPSRRRPRPARGDGARAGSPST